MAYATARDSRIVAATDVIPERSAAFAATHEHVRIFPSAESLLACEEVDAVVISTPPDQHAALCVQALKSGKAAVVEKPMARTFAECAMMLAAARSYNTELFVAYYRRAIPMYLETRRLIAEGLVGPVLSFHINYCEWPREHSQPGLKWRLHPKIGGGLFVDIGCQSVNLVDFLLGPVAEATGQRVNCTGHYDTEDSVVVLFRLESGPVGTGTWLFCSDREVDEIEVEGAYGRVVIPMSPGKPVRMFSRKFCRQVATGTSERLGPFVQDVVDCLLGRGPNPCRGEEAARTNWVIDQTLASFSCSQAESHPLNIGIQSNSSGVLMDIPIQRTAVISAHAEP